MRDYNKALRLPSKALPRVTSSAYSRSPPTGRPDANRVTVIPIDLSMRAKIRCSGFALKVGVGGDDDFLDGAVIEAGEEFPDPQLLRTDARDGINGPAQHVIPAAEGPRALHGQDVFGLLNDTDDRRVTALVAADVALFLLGHVEADGAELHAFLDRGDGRDQALHILRVGLKNVERQALR